MAVCSTLFDDICRGCGRTAMEVANWVFMTEEEKRAVWIRIKAQGYPGATITQARPVLGMSHSAG